MKKTEIIKNLKWEISIVVLSLLLLIIIAIHSFFTKKKKCPDDFEVFKKAYWPAFLENECGENREKNCCVKDKRDAGGLTCYGVAVNYNHKFYSYLREMGKLPEKLKHSEVSKLDSTPVEPYAQLKIYMNYFKKPKINQLPIGLKEVVFDNTVHAGPGQAIKLLQKACKTHIDGHIGNKTIEACKDLPYDKYLSERLSFLKKKKSWKTYANGFQNRIDRQHKQASEVYDREVKLKKNCS